MKKLILCFVLVISLLFSCSYGLAKPKTIDIDCIDEPLYEDLTDTLEPPIVVDPPATVAPPVEPDPPAPEPPLIPTIEAHISFNSLPTPFLTVGGTKALGTAYVEIEGAGYSYPELLPAGWTFSATSSVASVTPVQLKVNELRIFSRGRATEEGFITVELALDGVVMARLEIPII